MAVKIVPPMTSAARAGRMVAGAAAAVAVAGRVPADNRAQRKVVPAAQLVSQVASPVASPVVSQVPDRAAGQVRHPALSWVTSWMTSWVTGRTISPTGTWMNMQMTTRTMARRRSI